MHSLLSSMVLGLSLPSWPIREPGAQPDIFTRQELLRVALFGGCCAFGASPACAADDPASDTIFSGVLQLPKGAKFVPPPGTTASITLRVVGRNTNGPLGRLDVPLEGATFPVDFTIRRDNMRDGLPEFIWAEDDIYLKADVLSAKGDVIAAGKSKSKFVGDATPTHQIAYVTLDPQG